MAKWLKSAVVFFTFFIASVAVAKDFPAPPNPFRYVNDYTRTLSTNEVNYLENKLQDYSHQTSSQIAVVIIGSTGQYAIADYAFQLGDQWGIGRKNLDNGVLLLVAKNDRKVFIATGYGLEGALPDALLSQIIRKVILPNFRSGNYGNGINQALDHIIAASQKEYDALPADAKDEGIDDYIPFIMVCVFILFVLFGEISWRAPYVSRSHSHQHLQNAAILAGMLEQSRRNRYGNGNSGGFGGGFGGGDSGGFGGGSFGGGGAGGSW